MNKDQIIEFVSNFGFDLWSTERSGEDTIYHFMESRYCINLWVNADTLSFRFAWAVPRTIAYVESNEMSPLSNKDYFKRMYHLFKNPVRVLYWDEKEKKDSEE